MKFTHITFAYHSSVPPRILKDYFFSHCILSSRRVLHGPECVPSPAHDRKGIDIYNKLMSKNKGVELHNFYTKKKKMFHYYKNEHISNINEVVIAK